MHLQIILVNRSDQSHELTGVPELVLAALNND